jgi:hypothetical protein
MINYSIFSEGKQFVNVRYIGFLYEEIIQNQLI